MTPSLKLYLEKKAQMQVLPPARECCLRCRKPRITCYCEHLTKVVTTHPRVVILMHPLEAKHPVGTGRMAHRCLGNSQLHIGSEFQDSKVVNDLLNDPKLAPLLLFPGPRSQDLSAMAPAARRSFLPPDRESVVIVLDATWHLAKKMLHRSPNLQRVPRICFTPPRLSRFLVRKQPNPQCFSTIEAVHELLSLLDTQSRPERDYDCLLDVFDKMVAHQLSFRSLNRSRHSQSYLDRKARRQKASAAAAVQT